MTNSDRERMRRTFDEAAEQYEVGRPGYPDQLFADLVELCDLGSGARLLEIGCGTGQATRSLAERGFRIVSVELGARLADVARRMTAEYPHVRVVTSAFETWEPDEDSFDLVFAPTSWKWVDPDVRYAKAASLLRADGHLAVFSNEHGFPADADPFFAGIQDIYTEIGERVEQWPPPLPEEIPTFAEEIRASGLFEDITEQRYVWEIRYTAEEYIGLLDTFSGHIAMEAWQRERLYGEIRRRLAERPDRSVRRHWLTLLNTARLRRDQLSGRISAG